MGQLGRFTSTPYLVLFVILGAIGITTASAVGGFVTFSLPIDMGDNEIINLKEPTADSDAATKGYVDSLFSCEEATQPCMVVVGECENSGINLCMMRSTQCSVSPGAPSPDICDGLDNDCDGTADEDFDLQNDLNNCGACGNICDFGNAIGVCSTFGCTPICDPGFGNCDGIPVA